MKKNILITGTSKGIGKYLLDNLKNENNLIGISRSKSTENGFYEINIDLTNHALFNKITHYLKSSNIKLDCIIINAGVGHFGKYNLGDSKKYQEIINLNLLSPILLIKELEEYLSEKAKIIFIGSIISKKFMKYGAVYQASKFGLRGFAGALKNELKGKGVHIINPRIVETGFHDKSEIEIDFGNDKITSLESIGEVIGDILSENEKRFEIDL
ncbi:MAG: SDR family NAD(P)-dependent oxidoreductase [Candidatus Gracilibacteria bacterium]|nr:SDR family NAD(P)-dependent oxidoreductase [Candidatus Gracilibacteria bacterium]